MAKNVTRTVVYERKHDSGEPKFAGLHRVIADAQARNMTCVLVTTPAELGDDYAELLSNLDAIAAADLALQIVPPTHRTTFTTKPQNVTSPIAGMR